MYSTLLGSYFICWYLEFLGVGDAVGVCLLGGVAGVVRMREDGMGEGGNDLSFCGWSSVVVVGGGDGGDVNAAGPHRGDVGFLDGEEGGDVSGSTDTGGCNISVVHTTYGNS